MKPKTMKPRRLRVAVVCALLGTVGCIDTIDETDVTTSDEVSVGEVESALSEECSVEPVCVGGICSVDNCGFSNEESEDSGQTSGGSGAGS